MVRNFLLAAISIGAASLAIAQPGDQSGMTPGLWRTTTTIQQVDIPGLPAEVADMMRGRMMRSHSSEQCVSADDLNPDSSLFADDNAENCEYRDFTYAGGRMNVVLVCSAGGAGQMTMRLSGTGGPSSYESDYNVEFTGGQMGSMTMQGVSSGERVGDC